MCASSGFIKTEGSRDVESIKDIPFLPSTNVLPDKLLFYHASGIGEVKLKYVATRFNVYTKRECIAVRIGKSSIGFVVIVIFFIPVFNFTETVIVLC